MSLHNRTILVTRSREQAGEMVREIERRGGRAVIVPMLSINPPASWKECDEALTRLGEFDAIAFMSVNAVRSFYKRARVLGVPKESVTRLPALAVGAKTAEVIETFDAQVATVPGEFNGKSLARLLGSSYAGKRVLIPRGSMARDEIVEALQMSGATVETVTVYTTGKAEGADAAALVASVLKGEFDVATFASPSAAENFGSLFTAPERASIAGHSKIAAIGPSTADALRGQGLTVDIVARESTGQNLVACIDEFFS